MSITFKINNTGLKAQSIINMLKILSLDYDFIEMYDDTEELPELSEKEYKKRYEYTIEHFNEGISIEELESKLLNHKKV